MESTCKSGILKDFIMSNLIEQIFALEEGRGGDAIILQNKVEGSNGAPNYFGAQAIIQRINTVGGWQWCLRTLMPTRDGPMAGSGIYGDIDYVVKATEKQFGIKSDVREWVVAEYRDPDFPPNLIPM
jgi:hypothetical protein